MNTDVPAEAKTPLARLPLAWRLPAETVRLMWWGLLFLLGAGLLFEGVARLLGQKPQMIAATLSATVPDSYAGWQLRPNVTTGPDWVATNSRGLHDRRDLPLKPQPEVLRVAVQGSSVAYGPGLYLKDTLPMQLENLLNERGHKAEVLNFGVHGYNLLNVLGQSVAYTLQHEPHVVVLVLDLQVSYPADPPSVPQIDAGGVKRLSVLEGWLKKGSEYSVLLTWLDSPAGLRSSLDALGVPLQGNAGSVGRQSESRSRTEADRRRPATLPSPQPRATSDEEPPLPQRSPMRSQRLRSLLAAVLAAYRESGVGVVVVPPFGPYYLESDENLARFSLQMIANYAEEYGGFRQALAGELKRINTDIREIGRRYDAVVLDLDAVNRQLTLATSDYISSDGIHPAPAGYQFLAKRIADSLAAISGPRQRLSP